MAAGELSARKAVDVLESMSDFEVGLRHRTEGISWIVWGLALAGMFLSYAFLGPVSEDHPAAMPLMMVLWVPWVAVGAGASYAMWRSAGLALGEDAAETREGFRRRLVVSLLVVAGAWFLACFAGAIAGVLGWRGFLGPDGFNPGVFPLLLVGTITIIMGVARSGHLRAGARGLAFAMGTAILAAAVILAYSGWTWSPIYAASAVVAGGTYLAGGFLRIARG